MRASTTRSAETTDCSAHETPRKPYSSLLRMSSSFLSTSPGVLSSSSAMLRCFSGGSCSNTQSLLVQQLSAASHKGIRSTLQSASQHTASTNLPNARSQLASLHMSASCHVKKPIEQRRTWAYCSHRSPSTTSLTGK